MIKKLLAVLLCFCFAVPMFAMAEEEEFELMKFNSAEYTNAVEFLVTLGVLSPDSEYLKSESWTVSRGEFVNLVINSIGYSELMGSLTPSGIFSDVPADHPYARTIEFAYQSGMFGKNKGVFFRPDAPLDMELAAQMAVNITGQAIYLNGSDNYLGIAYKAKFFEGVNSYDSGKINRGNSLVFLENLLCADVVTTTSITPSGSVSIDTDSDETVISSYLKLEKRTGVVTSDGITTVFGEKPSPGSITVDGDSYVCIVNNYVGLAGKLVTCYIDNDDVIRVIDDKKNNEITIDADSILNYNASSASYEGIIDGSRKNIRISRDAYYVYNFEPGYSAELMKPESGCVTLIDHNGDNVYDAVLVEEYTNIVVNTYSSYSETIYDEEDSAYDLDLSQFRNCRIVDLRGNEMLPESIQQYSIVSLYESIDGKNAHLVVSNNHKSGKLSVIDNENDTVTVEETEYQLSSEARFESDALQLGGEYEFYFDSCGEIAYIKSDSGLMAYLLESYEYRESGKRVVEVSVLDETTKKINSYKLAKKVKVIRPGEEDCKLKAEDVYKTILLDASNNYVREMVLIKLNSASEITQIVFPMELATYAQYAAAPQYPLYNLSYLANEMPGILTTTSNSVPVLRYRSATGGFNRWVVLGSGSMMFYVPAGQGDIEDPDSVVAKFTNYGSEDSEKLSEISFYSKDIDDVSVRYMVKKAVAQADFASSVPGFITDLRWVYDSKLDETVCRIKVLNMSGEYLYYTDSADAISISNVEGDNIRSDKERLEVGDAVKFITNEAGYITKFSLMWDAKAGIDEEYNDNGDRSARFGALAIPNQTTWDQGGWTIVPGIVEKKSGNTLEYIIDKTDTLVDVEDRAQRIRWGASNKAYIIDYSNSKAQIIDNASANELIKGDRIVILTYSGQSYVLVVYRR